MVSARSGYTSGQAALDMTKIGKYMLTITATNERNGSKIKNKYVMLVEGDGTTQSLVTLSTASDNVVINQDFVINIRSSIHLSKAFLLFDQPNGYGWLTEESCDNEKFNIDTSRVVQISNSHLYEKNISIGIAGTAENNYNRRYKLVYFDSADNKYYSDVYTIKTTTADNQYQPALNNIASPYVLTLDANGQGSIILSGSVSASNGGNLKKVTIRYTDDGEIKFTKSIDNINTNSLNLADFGDINTNAFPFNTVGSYRFIIYAAADNFTTSQNDIGSFVLKVERAGSKLDVPTEFIDYMTSTYPSYDINAYISAVMSLDVTMAHEDAYFWGSTAAERAAYVNTMMKYYLLSTEGSIPCRVARQLMDNKAVVFFFDGCSNNCEANSTVKRPTYNAASVCVVIRLINGLPSIKFVSHDASSIPDYPTETSLSGEGLNGIQKNEGTPVPTVIDGIHSIRKTNHTSKSSKNGKYAALNVVNADVIRIKEDGTIQTVVEEKEPYKSSAINIHARSGGNAIPLTGIPNTTGCLNVGFRSNKYSYVEYNNFINAVTDFDDAKDSVFNDSSDVGVVVIDRYMNIQEMNNEYGQDITNIIMKHTLDIHSNNPVLSDCKELSYDVPEISLLPELAIYSPMAVDTPDSTNGITVSWSQIPGAAIYRIAVRDLTNNANEKNPANYTIDLPRTNGAAYTIQSGSEGWKDSYGEWLPGTNYRIWVVAVGTDGKDISVGKSVTFTTFKNTTATVEAVNVEINENGQIVDSLNGIKSVYQLGNSDTDTTYSCAAYVKKYYESLYGVTVSNLQTNGVPASNSGKFNLTDNPDIGDIGYQTNSSGFGHWFIVKALNNDGSYTVVEQNWSWESNGQKYCKINRNVSYGITTGLKFYRLTNNTIVNDDWWKLYNPNYNKKITPEIIDKLLQYYNSPLASTNLCEDIVNVNATQYTTYALNVNGTKYSLHQDSYYLYKNSLGVTQIKNMNNAANLTPAQMIYYACVENDMNIVYMLATLQKEQGLIRPSSEIYINLQNRLNRATGYMKFTTDINGENVRVHYSEDEKYCSFLGQVIAASNQFWLFTQKYGIYSMASCYDKYTPASESGNMLFDEFMKIYDSYSKWVDNALTDQLKLTYHCPVEVRISTDDEYLSSFEDDISLITSFGELRIEDNGESKIFIVDKDNEYDIEVSAYETGEMTLIVESMDENGILIDRRTFNNIPVTQNTTMRTDADLSEDMEIHVLDAGNYSSLKASNDLLGGITISGIICSYNPNNTTTVELRQNNEVKYQHIINSTDGSGEIEQIFEITGVTQGVYDIVISKIGHLTYTIKNVIVAEADINLTNAINKDYYNIILMPGDVNGDGYINNIDFMLVVSKNNYLKESINAVNNTTDINGDGYVNNIDFMIIVSKDHYLKTVTEVNY